MIREAIASQVVQQFNVAWQTEAVLLKMGPIVGVLQSQLAEQLAQVVDQTSLVTNDEVSIETDYSVNSESKDKGPLSSNCHERSGLQNSDEKSRRTASTASNFSD